MFHARTLGRLGLWEILLKRIYTFCAQGLNLGGYDSFFFKIVVVFFKLNFRKFIG